MIFANYWQVEPPNTLCHDCVELLDVSRLLIQETDHELDLHSYNGPKEGFCMWQQNADPLYYERPLQERFEIAITLAHDVWNGPDTFRVSLAHGPLPSLALSMTDSQGNRLLHAVAWALGLVCSYDREWLAPEHLEVNEKGKAPK